MPLTVSYFAGLASGLGAFGDISVYLSSSLRFPDANLTSAGASTVVTTMPVQGPREIFCIRAVSGSGFIRPRRAADAVPAAAEVAKGIPIDDTNNTLIELEVSQGWVLDLVAAA